MNKKERHAVIATPSDKIYCAVVSNSENTEWHTIQQQNKKSESRWNEWKELWLCVSVSAAVQEQTMAKVQ